MHTTKRHYPVIYGWDGVGDTQVTGQSVAKPGWSTSRQPWKGHRADRETEGSKGVLRVAQASDTNARRQSYIWKQKEIKADLRKQKKKL